MEQVLAILDGEEAYVSKLIQYINHQNGLVFSAVAFTNEDSLKEYMKRHRPAMLLCESSMYEKLTDAPVCPTMLLSDLSMVRESGGVPIIFKFQSAQEIVKEIFQYYEKVYPTDVHKAEIFQTKVCVVVSPLGGCGVTSVSEQLAKHLSKEHKVFFLSLDPFYVCEMPEGAEGYALSEAVYQIKQKSMYTKQNKKIEQCLEKKGNLTTLAGVTHWADLSECMGEEMSQLITEVQSGGDYEYILIDGGEMTDALAGVLGFAGRVFLLSDGRKGAEQKLLEFRRQFEFRYPNRGSYLMEINVSTLEEAEQCILRQLLKER